MILGPFCILLILLVAEYKLNARGQFQLQFKYRVFGTKHFF